jgi:hypothetical protein
VCRESAQKAFDEAAKSLNMDWNTTLDGKQLQRWSEANTSRNLETIAVSRGKHGFRN